MATYPPNQTTPAKGSGNYLWNWLGSSLKKFGAAISPYITGGGGATYKRYAALLSQSGTSNPVVTILENSLGGDPNWWTPGTGDFYCELTGAFPVNKTICITQQGTWGNNTIMFFGRDNNDRCRLLVINTDGTNGPINPQNAPENDWTVVIEVYP